MAQHESGHAVEDGTTRTETKPHGNEMHQSCTVMDAVLKPV